MKKSSMTLFAIYKNERHLGNERGKTIDDAINNYLIAALFEEFLDDLEFKSLYSGKVARKKLHYS